VSTIVVIGAVYIAMCLILSALATWIEKRGRRAKTGIAVARRSAGTRSNVLA